MNLYVQVGLLKKFASKMKLNLEKEYVMLVFVKGFTINDVINLITDMPDPHHF